MGAEIDRLEIAIESKATKANNALDDIVNKLERLSNALNSVNGGGLTAFAQGIEKIASASSQLHNVKTADFTRLSKNIRDLSTLNNKSLYGAAHAMWTMASAMNGFGNVSANSVAVAGFAKDISKLGNKNVVSAIDNMPRLASALKAMMETLSKAPTVSKNLIQMTNALAGLASQGNKVGSASNILISGLNRTGSAMSRTRTHTLSLASAFGKFYATYFPVIRGMKKIWKSIESSMGYVETLNYFDAAFGQVAEKADLSAWKEAGADSAQAYYDSFSSRAKELTSKMTGFNISDTGVLSATGKASLGIDPNKLMNYQGMFAQMSSSMGVTSETSLKLSEALTKIGADLASVKNMDFDKVWTDMASGLAGMSRTLDKYGANIRNVNLQQKLNELGIKANITALNQNDKALLRTIILLDSTRYAWGDLADTLNLPANQMRLLTANFGNLARAIGNLFLPVVAKVLPYINGLVIALQRLVSWLGSLLGVDMSKITSAVGGSSDAVSDLLDSADGTSDALGSAADNAKKLKNITMGIDELNIVSQPEESGSGGGVGGIGSGLLDDAFLDAFKEYQIEWDRAFEEAENRAQRIADRIIAAFKRGDWYGIGEYLSISLRDALNKIPWDTVYDGAKRFGTGLAEFLNGLIRPDTFYAVGQTVAGALNTAIYAALSFGEEFDFANFGTSLAAGVNGFFQNYDFAALAQTLNVWVDGLKTTIASFLDDLSWEDILDATTTFLDELELDTLAVLVGAITWKFAGKKLTAAILGSEFVSTIGHEIFATGVHITIGATIGFTVGTGIKDSILKAFLPEKTDWDNGIKAISDYEERYKGLSGTINMVSDSFSAAKNAIFGLPFIESGNRAGAMAIELEKISNGAILSDEKLQKLKTTFRLTSEDMETLRQAMLDANPEVFEMTNSFKELDTLSFESLEDISYGLSLIKDGTVDATNAFEEFRKPMWGMNEDALNFFSTLQNGNVDISEITGSVSEMTGETKSIFGTWSNDISEKVRQTVENIKSCWSEKWDGVQVWLEENVAPWFSAEQWYNIGQGILDGFALKWEEFKLWWQETALFVWWEENVVPWFSIDTWYTLADGILQGISTKWNDLVKLWTTNITKWWNTNVAPWFTVAKWQTLGENLKNGVFNGFKGIAQKTVDVLNSIIAAFEGMVNKVVDKVNDLIEKINDALGAFVPNIPSIKFKADFGRIPVPQFAEGGFPTSGEMFLARENGINEYVGRIGHRSAVANNDQIVESVSIGVAYGVETAVSNALAPYLQQIAQNTRETADKDMSVNIDDRDIARANMRGTKAMGLRLRTT